MEGLGLIDHGLDTNVNLAQNKEKAKAKTKAKIETKHPGHEEAKDEKKEDSALPDKVGGDKLVKDKPKKAPAAKKHVN